MTLSILGVLAALCFGLISWAAYHFIGRNKVQTKKITLMCGLIAIAIFGFLIIYYWEHDHFRWNIVKKYFKEVGTFNILLFFFILSIVAIVLALLNAIFNFLGT